ncbi:hypothetical protein EV426DRAFT_576010 [Tirmania nivea]|nr:hypothetical protein EV426DRAFT_576010 [Tirmania nivea]
MYKDVAIVLEGGGSRGSAGTVTGGKYEAALLSRFVWLARSPVVDVHRWWTSGGQAEAVGAVCTGAGARAQRAESREQRAESRRSRERDEVAAVEESCQQRVGCHRSGGLSPVACPANLPHACPFAASVPCLPAHRNGAGIGAPTDTAVFTQTDVYRVAVLFHGLAVSSPCDGNWVWAFIDIFGSWAACSESSETSRQPIQASAMRKQLGARSATTAGSKDQTKLPADDRLYGTYIHEYIHVWKRTVSRCANVGARETRAGLDRSYRKSRSHPHSGDSCAGVALGRSPCYTVAPAPQTLACLFNSPQSNRSLMSRLLCCFAPALERCSTPELCLCNI